jgi:hypothetical protein
VARELPSGSEQIPPKFAKLVKTWLSLTTVTVAMSLVNGAAEITYVAATQPQSLMHRKHDNRSRPAPRQSSRLGWTAISASPFASSNTNCRFSLMTRSWSRPRAKDGQRSRCSAMYVWSSKLKANGCPLLDRDAPSSHRNRSSRSFRRLRHATDFFPEQ